MVTITHPKNKSSQNRAESSHSLFSGKIKKTRSKTSHRQEFLNYLGLGAVSGRHREKLCNDFFCIPPYQIEIENWGNEQHTVFRRGRFTLKDIQRRVKNSLDGFLKSSGRSEIYMPFPASKLTKSHKIVFSYGRKSVKDLLKEKRISERQRHNLMVLVKKNNTKNVVFFN